MKRLLTQTNFSLTKKLFFAFICLIISGVTSTIEAQACGGTPLDCDQTRSGDLRNETNNYNRNSYSNCTSSSSQFDGAEKVYNFYKDNTNDEITIRLNHGSETNLTLFIMECVSGEGYFLRCLGQGDNFSVNGTIRGETWTDNGTLPTGFYYAIVEAADPSREAPYSISYECNSTSPNCHEATHINCEQTWNGDLRTEDNNFDINHFQSCGNYNVDFSGGDKIYRFTVSTSGENLTFTMNHGSQNLSMFLIRCTSSEGGFNVQCLTRGDNFPSDTNPQGEIISGTFNSGTYYIVIESADQNRESAFSLTMSCQTLDCSDYRDVDCNFSEFWHTYDADSNVGTYYCDGSTQVGLSGGEIIYRIRPDETDEYTFELSRFENGRDLDMFLLSSCDPNACLAHSDGPNRTNPDKFTYTLLANRTYYLIVDTDLNSGNSESNYKIDITCKNKCQTESGDLNCHNATELIPDNYVNCSCDRHLVDTSKDDATEYCHGEYSGYCSDEVVYYFHAKAGIEYYFSIAQGSEQPKIFLFNDCHRDSCLAVSTPHHTGEWGEVSWGSCEDKMIYVVVDEEDADDWCACVHVEEIGPLSDCDLCYEACCHPDDLKWLDVHKMRLSDICNECNDNSAYGRIYQHNFDVGICLIEIVYNYCFSTVPEHEFYDCSGNPTQYPLDLFGTSSLIWECINGDYDQCPSCYSTCCRNEDNIHHLINDLDCNSTVYQCQYEGQCVYRIEYDDPPLLDEEGGVVYDCSGTEIFRYNYFATLNLDLLDSLKNCKIIWRCDTGLTPECECYDPSVIDPTIDCDPTYEEYVCACDGYTYINACVARENGLTSWTEGPCPIKCKGGKYPQGHCERFETYNGSDPISDQSANWDVGFTGNSCFVSRAGGTNRFLAVGRDANDRDCSNIYTLPSTSTNPNSFVLEWKMYIPSQADIHQGSVNYFYDDNSISLSINFQPGFITDPRYLNINDYDNHMVFYQFPLDRWFDVSITLNNTTGQYTLRIDDIVVHTGLTNIDNFASFEMDSNLTSEGYVWYDDICLYRCDKATKTTEIIESNITIFPNPARDFISIKNHETQITTIRIVDTMGKTVKNFILNTSEIIDISALSPGIYFVSVDTKEKTYVQKLIKL